MSPSWAPEIVVDEQMACGLITSQFPDLQLHQLRQVGEGWDNTVWLVNEELVFRFPRRIAAVPTIERETAILPQLAPHLPEPIPTPVLLGVPSQSYPWPFWGGRHLPGREIGNLDDESRRVLAGRLGRFLRRLHSLDAAVLGPQFTSLPIDPNRRADMSHRVRVTQEALAEIETLGLWRRSGTVDDILAQALNLPSPGCPALVHGDLHFRHLLIDDAQQLSGVIDWGDVCRADPAVDLQLVWSLLPAAARPAFFDAYGTVSEEQLIRARVLALCLSAMLAAYGHNSRIEGVVREALAGLDRAVAS